MTDIVDKHAHARIDKLEAKHMELERAIAENTKLTQTIANNTGELVELVKGVKGIRTLIVWATPLVVCFFAVIAYIRGH